MIDNDVVDTLTLSAITGQLSLQMGNVGTLNHLCCFDLTNTVLPSVLLSDLHSKKLRKIMVCEQQLPFYSYKDLSSL